MADFNDAAKALEELAKLFSDVDEAVRKEGDGPNAPENIQKELGQNIKKVSELDGPTPLAETPEIAKMESEEKVKTRLIRLDKFICQKIEDTLNG